MTTADVAWFVVRSDGRWTLTPIPASDPEQVELARVVELLDHGTAAHAVDAAAARALSPDDLVAPVWMFVGQVANGALRVETPDGAPVELDATDLRLLDAITAQVRTADVAAPGVQLDDTELRARLARLVDAACLSVQGRAEPAPAPVVAAPPPAAVRPSLAERLRPAALRDRVVEAYRLSSKVQRVRGALARFRSGGGRSGGEPGA